MRDQSGRILSGQKSQLKNLLSPKNKVFGVAENFSLNYFNFKIFVAIFLILAMSSKLDTGIWRSVHAATSTTITMKLKDLPVGGVINLGAYNYVKIADNQFMQTEVAACPDGKTVAGKYVKCFDSNSAYTQTCTGSYYCGSGTEWNSTANACVPKCGEHATWSDDSCVCDSGYYYSVSGTSMTPYITTVALDDNCSIHYDSNTGYFVQNGTNYYLSSGGTLKTGCDGKMIGGFCWGEISSTTYTYADRNSGCASGYSVPTSDQFYALENIVGCVAEYYAGCEAIATPRWGGEYRAIYWSATARDAAYAYTLEAHPNISRVYLFGTSNKYYVRCIKN